MTRTSRYAEIEAYTTRDGSLIRELMHPSIHASHNQSLAEATVPAGSETLLHKHLKTEELYHITQGRGLLTLDDDILEVSSGDTICIAPNTPHKIKNTGTLELKILCCCSPAYSHDDTVLIESENSERQ